MGIYINRTSKGDLDFGRPLEDQLIEDGAVEQPHPHYEAYVVCVFRPMGTYQVCAFVYSRKEFWRFFNNPAPQRWFTYPYVANLHQGDVIRLHLLDVEGPETFEEIDRREEMAAMRRELSDGLDQEI